MSMMSEALDSLYETIHDPAVAGELVSLVVGDKITDLYAVLEKSPAAPPVVTGFQPGTFDLAKPSDLNMDHDFSVLAEDYAIDGVPLLPARNHELRREVNGVVRVYVVMASVANGTLWEWQDGYTKRYMIHTKYVRDE